MRRLGAGVGLLALGLLAALGLSGSAAGARSQPSAVAPAKAHLQVIEIEYKLILSRGVVKAGPVSLEAIDRGMDPHDLRLRKIDGSHEYAAPLLTPGERWNETVDLKPGVYKLWCALPEHAKLGMRATLHVVR